MLVVLTGRGRTEADYRDLLAAAGFTLERIIPTQAGCSVIERMGYADLTLDGECE